jgi:AcrR family transcriptional regulator
MRPSNRTMLLEAAARLIERQGAGGVTIDSVAAEAGLTKGGLLYHFASRAVLLQAIHQHLADQWETSMIGFAGKAHDQCTAAERTAAYIKANIQSATRAELLFMLDGAGDPAHSRPWDDVMGRWAPSSAPAAAADDAALARFVAGLAADGLWMHESLTNETLDPEFRARIAEYIVAALGG